MEAIPHNQYVVSLLGSFSQGTQHYIAMEYCDKGDLSYYLKRAGMAVGVLDIPEWKVWRFLI